MDSSVREPAAAWPPPPRVLPNHSWTDYARWEGDWELIRGVPYSMSPSPKFRHFQCVERLRDLLRATLPRQMGLQVFSEMDWVVDQSTVIRPDVMIATPPRGDDWVRQPPLLVAEVLSPSTAAKDRIEKRAICAEAGVPLFVLADPATRVVDAFVLRGADYAPVPAQDGRVTLDIGGAAVCLDPAVLFAD
jgi:Uma2 family endonuclease